VIAQHQWIINPGPFQLICFAPLAEPAHQHGGCNESSCGCLLLEGFWQELHPAALLGRNYLNFSTKLIPELISAPKESKALTQKKLVVLLAGHLLVALTRAPTSLSYRPVQLANGSESTRS
jgi:hypothetical protein